MNLKIYNTTNSRRVPQGKPFIRVHRKSGVINISKAAHEAVGITTGVEMLQDQDHPCDWYIRASDAPEAIPTRRSPSGVVYFNSAEIARIMGESLPGEFLGKASIKIPVAPQPVDDDSQLYALLTKAAK